MKALFCRIDFNYTTNFVKKCFLFFSIFFFCENYILNSILLQNFHFYVIIFAFKAFFPSFFKVDIHSTNVSCATDPIRWPSFFFQSYRLEELINTLLKKWNISQTFLIHFTLYLYLWWSLYLWWRVPRLIYIFPKVSSCHFTFSFFDLKR